MLEKHVCRNQLTDGNFRMVSWALRNPIYCIPACFQTDLVFLHIIVQ